MYLDGLYLRELDLPTEYIVHMVVVFLSDGIHIPYHLIVRIATGDCTRIIP